MPPEKTGKEGRFTAILMHGHGPDPPPGPEDDDVVMAFEEEEVAVVPTISNDMELLEAFLNSLSTNDAVTGGTPRTQSE